MIELKSMALSTRELLEHLASWSEEDIRKLTTVVCQIEAWRNDEVDTYSRELPVIEATDRARV
jgi:hypothetical protein